MENRIGHQVDVQHSTRKQSTTYDHSIADQIGPRLPGTVFDNASGMFQVLQVVTDPSEARRVLRRNAARFAIHVLDLHAGTEHYTGAVWTGSDRVLKAVA